MGHNSHPHRVDPFVFPSTTTFRFALLIAAALSATFFAYDSLYHELRQDRVAEVHARCAAEAESAVAEPPPGAGLDVIADEAARGDAYDACAAGETRVQAMFSIVGMLIVVAGTVCFYWFLPSARITRRKLEPISRDEVPELVDHLEELRGRVGIPAKPTYLWAVGNRSTAGLTFGNLRRKYVMLPDGLIALYGRDREAFDAIVAHEFAHLRNRDVDQTWLTITAWWSFALFAIAPLAIAMIDQSIDLVWSVSWRMLVLVAIVFGIRQAVLRSREYYADIRASMTVGVTPMGTVIDGLAADTGWRRMAAFHPPSSRRSETVRSPDKVLGLTPLDALVAGIVAMVALENSEILFSRLHGWPIAPSWMAAFVFVPIVAGVLALGAWHVALVDHVLGRRAQLWKSGAALGLGIWLGRAIAFESAAIPTASGLTDRYNLAWALLVIVLLTLFAGWVETTARLWIQTSRSRTAIRVTAGICLFTAMVVLLGALGLMISMADFSSGQPLVMEEARRLYASVASQHGTGPEWLWLLFWHPIWQWAWGQWFTLPLLAVVLLVPLAARMRRRRFAEESPSVSWALIDEPSDAPAISLSRLHIGTSMRIAGLGGLIAGLLLAGFRMGVHVQVPEVDRLLDSGNDAFFLAFGFWSWVIIAVVQILVAVVLRLRVPQHGVILGLLGALVSGVIGYLFLGFWTELGGCVWILQVPVVQCGFSPLGVLGLPEFSLFVVPGTLLALGVVALARLPDRLRDAARAKPVRSWVFAAVPGLGAGTMLIGLASIASPGSVDPGGTDSVVGEADRYELNMMIPEFRDGYLSLLATLGVEAGDPATEEVFVGKAVDFCRRLDAEGSFLSLDQERIELPEEEAEEDLAILTVAVNLVCPQHLEASKSDERWTTLSEADVTAAPAPPGEDPALDELWVECGAGDATACDELYWSSPVGSVYEEFAISCGGRGALEDCLTDRSDVSTAGSPPDSFGDDVELDLLWTACEEGDLTACDTLYWVSPLGSEYEEFGATCGGREERTGDCASLSDTLSETGPVKLVPGLFCQDLASAGYGFVHALVYWVREGRPDRMDADDNGIPCETVFAREEVDSVLYFDVSPNIPPNSFCRDVDDLGYPFAGALVYWVREGAPNRMDADVNGIPCETVYPTNEIEAVLQFDRAE